MRTTLMSRRPFRRRTASRTFVAGMASLAVLSALTGCTGVQERPGEAAVPDVRPTGDSRTARSEVTGGQPATVEVGGITVTVPPGATTARAVELRTLDLAAVELPDLGDEQLAVTALGPAAEVTLTGADGALAIPATVTFPIPPGGVGGDLVPFVVWQDGRGGWRLLPVEPADGRVRATITASTDHFSRGFLAGLDVDRTAEQWARNAGNYLTGVFGAAPPECGDERGARAGGVTVRSDGGSNVKWCFGLEKGQRVLKVTNNRRTYVEVQHPSSWRVAGKEPPGLTLESVDRAFGTAVATTALRRGLSARILDGGDTLTLAVPEGASGGVTTQMSVAAWLMSAIRFGVDVGAYVVKMVGGQVAEASDGSWRRISARIVGLEQMDGYTEALRGCGKALSGLSDVDATRAPDLLKFVWGCIPELMSADIIASGATMFGLGVVLSAVGAALGVVLTAVHLIVTGLRSVWDDLASFGGRSDSIYDILVAVAPAAERPAPRLVLGLGGTVGDLGLFADERTALGTLQASLGTPHSDTGWRSQPCGPRSSVERTVRWGGFQAVLVEGAPQIDVVGPTPAQAPVSRYLASWTYTSAPGEEDRLGLKTAEGVGLGASRTSVERAYPDAHVLDASSSVRGGPVLEVFRGDASSLELELTSGGRVLSMRSGSTGCPD